jgi:hypothetical protein
LIEKLKSLIGKTFRLWNSGQFEIWIMLLLHPSAYSEILVLLKCFYSASMPGLLSIDSEQQHFGETGRCIDLIKGLSFDPTCNPPLVKGRMKTSPP